jgi:hypothetical protein
MSRFSALPPCLHSMAHDWVESPRVMTRRFLKKFNLFIFCQLIDDGVIIIFKLKKNEKTVKR